MTKSQVLTSQTKTDGMLISDSYNKEVREIRVTEDTRGNKVLVVPKNINLDGVCQYGLNKGKVNQLPEETQLKVMLVSDKEEIKGCSTVDKVKSEQGF